MIDTVGASERSPALPSLGVVLIAKQLLEIVSLRKPSCLCLTMSLLGIVGAAKGGPVGISG